MSANPDKVKLFFLMKDGVYRGMEVKFDHLKKIRFFVDMMEYGSGSLPDKFYFDLESVNEKAIRAYFYFVRKDKLRKITPINSLLIGDYFGDDNFLSLMMEKMDWLTVEDMSLLPPNFCLSAARWYIQHCFHTNLSDEERHNLYYKSSMFKGDFLSYDLYLWYDANYPNDFVQVRKGSKKKKYIFRECLRRFITQNPTIAQWIWDNIDRDKLIAETGAPNRRRSAIKKKKTIVDLEEYLDLLDGKANFGQNGMIGFICKDDVKCRELKEEIERYKNIPYLRDEVKILKYELKNRQKKLLSSYHQKKAQNARNKPTASTVKALYK